MWVETPVADIKNGNTIKTRHGSETVTFTTMTSVARRILTDGGHTFTTDLSDHPIKVWHTELAAI